MKLIPIGVIACAPALAADGAEADYLYQLSDFSGTIPYNNVRIHVDRFHDEIYVAEANRVRVFNDSGMEIYWFGYQSELGAIRDLAVDEAGDIWVLGQDFRDRVAGPRPVITRCNYRGEPQGTIALSGLPQELTGFGPNRLIYRDGRLIFANDTQMLVVVTDRSGAYVTSYDLGELVGVPEDERSATEIRGFNVAPDGSLLFTVPVHFQAYRLSPDGEVTAWGQRGSGPGRFGLGSGIAVDDRGFYYISERLRGVVMVFDPRLSFVYEFGYNGDRPGNLIRPGQLAIGNGGKLYVTQMRNRGVSVFSLNSGEPQGAQRKEVPSEGLTTKPSAAYSNQSAEIDRKFSG